MVVALPALIVVLGAAAMFTTTRFIKSEDRFSWRLPSYVVTGASILLVSLVLYSPYSDFLYILLIAPIVCLILLALLLASAIRKRPRRCLSCLFTLVALLAASWGVLRNQSTLRAYFRWLLWSHSFKAEVLALPAPANGELRHMEWEATGFAGVANENVYLVFDPSDSLSAAHSPGKSNGIPCPFRLVHRLERHWYSVWFYTDEDWSECPWSRAAEGG